MGVPGSVNNLLGAGGPTAYKIERSIRLNSADSAYLNRTFGTPTTQNTFTLSLWVKRSNIGSTQQLFGVSTNNSFGFTSGDALNLTFGGTSALTTTAVFRDPSAWYHIVWSQSGTSHTLYVNNTNVGTATATSSTFNTAVSHQIGAANTTNYFNGYLADIYFLDGTATTPSTFAETDAVTGQWVPKTPTSISYGTNGFRLTFSDNSGTTSTTLGKDAANSNNFTPNNLSVTAGAGNDSLTDTPTSYGSDSGAGGEVRGNYATFNPINTLTTVTLANGNLDYSSTTASNTAIATIGMNSGKWYWEVVTTAGTTETQVGVYGTSASTLYSLAANTTVYGIRFDAGAGTLDRTSDGTNWTSIATGLTSGPYFPYFNNNGTTAKTVSVNFGQRAWSYTAPSGYKALCDTNLTAPTIIKPASYFDVITYTGTGANATIPNVNTTPTSIAFTPDFVWLKGRSGATDHALYDAVRGTEKRLESNTVDAEATSDGGVTAFNSAGFTVGTLAQVNTSSATYAAWCWDAGTGTGSTNNSGSIQSTVQASTVSGFSVVTWTGTGTTATIGHGGLVNLDKGLIIVKSRSTTGNWMVGHGALGWTKGFEGLNTSNAANTASSYWNDTAPTSTVFTVSGADANMNGNGRSQLAYCFAPVAGYSAFGSYTGTGTSDNSAPFIWTGFRPKYLLIKRSDSASDWSIWDSSRGSYNGTINILNASTADAEDTRSFPIDFLSNGFKSRTTHLNVSGGTYIYFAVAESPFQYARAR